jgi:hypothetical protein
MALALSLGEADLKHFLDLTSSCVADSEEISTAWLPQRIGCDTTRRTQRKGQGWEGREDSESGAWSVDFLGAICFELSSN